MNFSTIEYLKKGNPRQKAAYRAILSLEIFEILKNYQPILTGTIPIEVDLPNSDLDIICSAKDLDAFHNEVHRNFGKFNNFKIYQSIIHDVSCVVANFKYFDFDFEIFCQSTQTKSQQAYLHMLVEYRLLSFAHPAAKKEIRNLKSIGLKTEPAFTKLFQLPGDPYLTLIDLVYASNDDLKKIANRWRP